MPLLKANKMNQARNFDLENKELYFKTMQILRELAMHTNVTFSEDEEGFKTFSRRI